MTARVGVSAAAGTLLLGSLWLGVCLAVPAAPRARDLGIPFDGTPGPNNAITEGDSSGDIFLAFSTANSGADEGNSAQPPFNQANATVARVQSWKMNPLFTAVVQATEESVINAMIAAKTMTGADNWVVPALPQDQLTSILRAHRLLTH